jgi:nitric oxide dioxygenase
MIVKKYKAKILKIENLVEGLYTLSFVSDGGKFRYLPGQFLHLALDSEYDGSGQWPESRCFSLQTSPEEKYAKITYSVKGKFTQQMQNKLIEGEEVWLKMPYGDLFQQEHNKENTIFISGGTGITPFLSLFTDSSFANYQNPVLYAGYRNPSFNVYETELKKAISINPNLKIKNFYQDTDGVLDIEKIFNENNKEASYFISGPIIMIRQFKQKLENNGVALNNILTDDWE